MAQYDPLSKEALDQDWKVADGYTAYSAELLRLALLCVTALLTLLVKIFEQGGSKFGEVTPGFTRPFLALMISIGCALAHRFIATDSMAMHIEYLRRKAQLTGAANTPPQIIGLRRGRNLRFRLATILLLMSAGGLLAGVGLAASPVMKALSSAAAKPSHSPPSSP